VDEVVVVDDGSQDDTAEIIESFGDRLPIVLLRNERNCGIGHTLRRGVEAATGDWILRLDADDRWLHSHVAALANLVRAPGVRLVTSAAMLVDESGDSLGRFDAAVDETVRGRLMWDNPMIHSASGFLRTGYFQAGGYRENVRWEDYDLWIRLLAEGSLASSSVPSVEYTVSANSLSRTRRAVSIAGRWQCQRQAVAQFWRKHPWSALRTCTLGAARTLVSPLL